MNDRGYLYKRASDSWTRLLNPAYALASTTGAAVSKLPQLASDPHVNVGLWNALVTMGALGTIGTGLKLGSAWSQSRRFEKKKRDALIGKLNAIVPIMRPDLNLNDSDEVERRREEEVDSLTKKANDDDMSAGERLMRNIVVGALPVGAAVGGMYLGSKLTDDAISNMRKTKLKKDIQDRRNQLNAIYAEMVALARNPEAKTLPYMEKKYQLENKEPALLEDTGAQERDALLSKVANAYTKIRDATMPAMNTVQNFIDRPRVSATDTGRSPFNTLVDLPLVTAALTGILAAGASKVYFDRRDAQRKRVKLLEDKVLASNLTHQLPQLVLQGDNPEDYKLSQAETAK